MRSRAKITNSTEKKEVPLSSTAAYLKFQTELRETNTPVKFLKEKYKELFKTPAPAVSEELIKAKISYHLLVVEGYQKCNVPVPEKVMKNYLASKDLNIDGFGPGMASMLKLNTVKKEKEGDTMAVKKVIKLVKKTAAAPAKAKAVKGPRVSVSSIFAEIFAMNPVKKLTDEQIAKEVNAKAKGIGRGHVYTMKDIPVVRRKFNLGILAGQTGKPKVELKKFEAKK